MMDESRKYVFKETGIILLGEGVGLAIMFAVYALLGKFGLPVLLSGLIGAVLAAGNFFFMAMIATLAAERAQREDPLGGQKMIRSSYFIRLLVLAAALFLCAKSGYFDVLALALPLLFVRPALTVREFFRKKGA